MSEANLSVCATLTTVGRMSGQQSKQIPLGRLLKNFKKGYSGDYGVKLTPQKLRIFCEIDWPFGVGWPAEGPLDREVIAKVSSIITSQPGYPEQFPYIDILEAIVCT